MAGAPKGVTDNTHHEYLRYVSFDDSTCLIRERY